MRSVPSDANEHEVAPRVAKVMQEVAAELATGHVRSFEVLLAFGPPGTPLEQIETVDGHARVSSAA